MLEVENLTVSYGAATVLRGLSFRLSAGEAAALLGRNGAGKSTTLKAIMGLVPAESGSVAVEGAPLLNRPPHRIARLGVGYVPEDRRVFPDLTVRENLETGRRPGAAPLGPAWSEERLFTLFPNLAERRDALGRHLSGGEQQMLSIARTLMGAPKLLLLDEPSEGVAPAIVDALAEAVGELRAAGVSLLLSEQNARFAEAVADRALTLENGRIGFDGPFQDLPTEA